MKKSVLPLILCSLPVACTHASDIVQSPSQCGLAMQEYSELSAWREAGFATETPDQSATDLAACLGDSDSFLRDKMGYEGLTALLRSGAVSEQTRRDLIASLTTALQSPDEAGFHAPFAALVLAELARTDRVETFLDAAERAALAETASTYLSEISDYRAFSDLEGWRHGVAHGADFAMQLSLNPNVSPASLLQIRTAVTSQVTPTSGHAYTHNEPERLARPILFMASRGEIDAENWASWFAALADPAPLESWGDAFGSEAALARLHNLKAFAQALYINASLSQNPNLEPIATGALDLLKTLP